MTSEPSAEQSAPRDVLLSQRRALIRISTIFVVVCVVVIAGLATMTLMASSQAWNNDSRVTRTQGVVVDEVRGQGSCRGRGADYETRVEWTQGGEVRSASTSTCASGPDVGDTVDVWVRDDGQIRLTAPSTTLTLTLVGMLAIAGLAVFVSLKLRTNVRRIDQQLAATPSG